MHSASENPALELHNVGYYYERRPGYFSRQKFWALKQVNFTVYQGESLGIVGSNGSGKSTLLRVLANIVRPDRGSMVNHGHTASLISLQAGFVPYLSGRENTFLSGLILGVPKRQIREQLVDIMSYSGLGDFFDQPIYSYSSGMRARLGFSIAFQLNPDILLIDEVLGVGDESFRAKSIARMKEIIFSDKTVVVVSHALDTVKDLCARVVWIEGGVSQAEGAAEDVLKEYVSYVRTTRK